MKKIIAILVILMIIPVALSVNETEREVEDREEKEVEREEENATEDDPDERKYRGPEEESVRRIPKINSPKVTIEAPSSVTVKEGKTEMIEATIRMEQGGAGIQAFTFCDWNFYSGTVKTGSLRAGETLTWQIPVQFNSDSEDQKRIQGICKAYILGNTKENLNYVKKINVTGVQEEICEPGETKTETKFGSQITYQCDKGLEWEPIQVGNAKDTSGGGFFGLFG